MFTKIFTFRRFIFYGFPIYLVVAEYLIRFALSYAPGKAEDLAVVGSTSSVTAAGLSLIAATLIPKPVKLSASAAKALSASEVVVIGVRDQRLIFAAYIALLFLPFAWGWALWLVHTENARYDVVVIGARLPFPFLAAIAIYLFGMVFNELKEVV